MLIKNKLIYFLYINLLKNRRYFIKKKKYWYLSMTFSKKKKFNSLKFIPLMEYINIFITNQYYNEILKKFFILNINILNF